MSKYLLCSFTEGFSEKRQKDEALRYLQGAKSMLCLICKKKNFNWDNCMNWMGQFEGHKNKLRHTLTLLMKPFSFNKKNENRSQNMFSYCNLVFILEVEVD